MPRNSSGTYSLYTPGNPVVTSTVISSTWANNTLADLASAITDSLSRTGDGGMQAPLVVEGLPPGVKARTLPERVRVMPSPSMPGLPAIPPDDGIARPR